uniref:matrix metalloproteinase-14 isoform X3 n=1 Tax=Vespula vulgaris TaxID=7454 RepID=UPI00223ADD95|nr:matrix metalloproteinase-14 isoform X3 [Vespula vulgaris]
MAFHCEEGGGSMARRTIRSLLFLLAIVATFLCDKTEAAPTTSSISDLSAMRYLSQYGYLPSVNPANGGIISEESLSQAISEFQSLAGINITGSMNDETAYYMSLSRCGVKDKVGPSYDGRSKRYALQGSRWRVKKLSYRISKYPAGLSRTEVDKEIAKAFNVWSQYTDLSFTVKSSGSVHIDIRFEIGEHGDGDPFDGRGGTLAHAYFPVYGGDAHFDDAEQWTINSYRGTNLFQVAAHEFGHSLGLSHSDVKAALMAPFYRGYEPNFNLHSDDIDGIQALYGRRTTTGWGQGPTNIHPTSVPPTGEEDPELCMDPKIDTIFNSAEGHIYVFKGEHYWRLTADGIASGYPKRISNSWKGLPGNIDAAFTFKNGKTYFFKGSKYWRYIGKHMDGQYPKEISEGFTGIPDNIDAATVWTGNGKIYFYKGTKFWRFDQVQKPPVKSTYPKPIKNWEGLPDNLDGAVIYQGYTYFFKDKGYYRFNDRTFSVDVAEPAFPRATAYWWFGCKSASKGTLGGLDEQFATPSNQDRMDSGSRSIFNGETWSIIISIVTVIVARFIVAT